MVRCILIGSIVLAAAWQSVPSTLASGQVNAGAACGFGFGRGITLPVNRFPADIIQNSHSGNGILTLQFPSLSMSVSSRFSNPSAQTVGKATRTGCDLLLSFTGLGYEVDPITLPTGQRIGRQIMTLDPYRRSTIRVNGQTGKIARTMHWVLTATNARYNSSPSVALADRGKSTTQSFQKLGANRYLFTIRTAWRSAITLNSFEINGKAQPAGVVNAEAAFTGTYVLVFKTYTR